MIRKYETITNTFAKIGLWYIIVGYAAMTTVTFIEVIRRYTMGLSYGWAEELVRFLLITTTFIGGAVAYHKGSLVLFDVLLKKLEKKRGILLGMFNNTAVLLLALIIFKLAVDYVRAPAVMLQKSPGLGIPMVIPYGFIALGFALVCFFAVGHILHGWQSLRCIREEGGKTL